MSGPGGFNSTNMTMELRALRTASGSPSAQLARLSLHTPLVLVLILQVVGGAVLLHNTPFQDEALYSYAGTQLLDALLGGPPVPAYFAIRFSGYPYVYPLLAAVLLRMGGIEAVRWFSSACMLVVTVCVYFVTRRLFNQASALTAACLFACAGPTLLLSRLATFDALALMLLAVATAIAFEVSAARDPAGALMIGPLLILAGGAKYASLLFVPLVIGLMVVRTSERRGWGRAALHLALTVVGMVILAIPLAHVVDREALSAVTTTTTNRAAIIHGSAAELARIILSLAGPLWALSLFGIVLSPKRLRLVTIGLLLAAAAPAIYHLHAGELVSLQKHIGYGLFFAAPLAGFAVAEMTSRITPARLDPRWLAGMMICLIMFAIGAEESQWWYHTWPDSSQLVTTMRTQVRPGSSRYLCEDFEVLRLALSDVTANDQYTSLGFFEYTDTQGHHYVGEQAYESAIAAGYFDLVELSFSNSALSGDLEKTLRAQSQYELVAVIPYTNSYGSSQYMIWRKRGT